MEKDARFKYNLELEYALSDLFGTRHYNGMARDFSDHVYCKKCLLRAIKRIKNRLREIPMDERLIERTGSILYRLEDNVKAISRDVNNDWSIITEFLHLIIHLLGYDWLDGKIHRGVIFFQNWDQEQNDWKMQVGNREYFDNYRLEEKHRYMLVNQLSRNKVPKYQIARLLGLSLNRVNQILVAIPELEKESGRTIPKFE